MIEDIIETKRKIEEFKNKIQKPYNSLDMSSLCNVLIMLNIAEMVIYANIKVPENERYYFDRQAFVGRYFIDWGLKWISDDYLKVSKFIKANHW
jgi:hypothetical protein